MVIDTTRGVSREIASNPAACDEQRARISTDPFQNRDNQEIIDLIDQLLECGINKSIGIPQIVIVGDQSSGKSSLLQSLTDIPFPVGDGLCTRFPTQIVSRRARSGPETIKASIHERIFGKTPSPQIEAFARTLSGLTPAGFDELIKEASGILGVAQPDQPGFGTSKNFSTSTLRLEITGPGRTPFTVIDLPGLFHASTSSQTTSEITGIREIVQRYVSTPGTIIVAVANGLANAATQEIFEMARGYDEDGLRTVGVITKCDMVADAAEQTLKLAQNKTICLNKHGWFVVRNRSAKEMGEVGGRSITNEERHSRETKLFSEFPWTQLPETHRGVHALRDYLSTLLVQYSRSELPEIARNIQSLISRTRSELRVLGHSRDKGPRQRQFLQEITGQFQTAAESALSGHYSSSVLLGDSALKLRKRIVEANEKFANNMLTKGHMVEFKKLEKLSRDSAANTILPPEKFRSSNLQDPLASVKSSHLGFNQAPYSDTNWKLFFSNSQKDLPGDSVSTLAPNQRTTPSTIHPSIDGWIQEEIANNRGTELPGTPNPEVVPALFRRQTQGWALLAQEHLGAIQAIVRNSTMVLLGAICKDNAVLPRLQDRLLRFTIQPDEAAKEQLTALIQDVREKPLQTNNPLFGEKIQHARRLRFENALTRYLRSTGQLQLDGFESSVTRLDPLRLFDELHISNSENLVYEIHDTLKAYYDLAVVDFIEFVNKHIVERYVNSPDGPAKAFSPSWVGGLQDEELAELASESKETIAQRKQKETLLEKLTMAESILAGHNPGRPIE
ncbi:hypothetical protein GP486_004679 [Trichoglossum hirsutum]|uniref:GED domain-containing protein n=1 Tax=Trichoglossum hirsutum TaxID=265104 RepID=A0A9P8LAP4_9PEZI|nr:hypothetical protein GP486_004679 [Trichoglossum hirsutum]